MVEYADRDVTVIHKPAGLLSEPDGSGQDVLTAVKKEMGTDCFLVHRLDRGTSGLMVLANHKKAAAFLSKAVTDNCLKKEYLAVVSGIPEPREARLEDLLFKDSRSNRSYVVKRPRKGVKEAVLTYQVQAVFQPEACSTQAADENPGTCSLVRVALETGRTHQIRVQFASRRYPLLGDNKYGSRFHGSGPALHSCRLSFPHPTTGETMDFSSLPDQSAVPWCFFF